MNLLATAAAERENSSNPLVETVIIVPDTSNGVKSSAQLAETQSKQKIQEKKVSMQPPVPLKNNEGSSRLVTIFLLLTMLGLGAALFFLYRENNLRKSTVLQLQETEQARATLEDSLTQLRGDMNEQRKLLEKVQNDLKNANDKTVALEKARAESENQLSELKVAYDTKIVELSGLLKTRDTLIATLKSQVSNEPAELEGKPENAEGKSSESAAPSLEPASGEIQYIDKQNRFIVTTIGTLDGAAAGKFMQIYQNQKPLGFAKIERTYPHLSAAAVASEDTLSRVQKGDKVSLSLY